MSFGFFGIQFGFALQTGNASRILQTFGADVEHLSLFWLVAPLSGMLIQPIIGYFSDKTWARLGRRRPFFLGGALVAAAALALMPNASVLTLLIPPLLIGAGMLMIMDVAFNVSMEPFRALVADNLPKEQHGYGYAVQTFLIGAGAIIGSFLPYVLSEYLGVSKVAEQGHVPDNVIWSFYAGAIVLVLSLLWTVITTKEYSAEELRSFDEHADDEEQHAHSFGSIFKDFKNMPTAMKQLGLVQFFSWFALFSMWVFTTPAIAQHIYHLPASDTSSAAYADAGNLTGVLFGVYNLVATIFALILSGYREKENAYAGVRRFRYWPYIDSIYTRPQLIVYPNDCGRHCLGKYFGYAIFHPIGRCARKEDGLVYGFIQFLYHLASIGQWSTWDRIGEACISTSGGVLFNDGGSFYASCSSLDDDRQGRLA